METGNNNAAPTETANETVQSNKLKKRTKLSDVIMCCDKYSNEYRSKPGLPTCIYKLWNRLHHERKRQSCPVSCTDWRWRNWTSTTKQIAKEKSERRGEKKKKEIIVFIDLPWTQTHYFLSDVVVEQFFSFVRFVYIVHAS